MKVKLFFIAEGNTTPTYERDAEFKDSKPGKYIHTYQYPKPLCLTSNSEPDMKQLKSDERVYRYNSKLTGDYSAVCYLEVKRS